MKVIPTDSTLELIPAALRILENIYRPGFAYRKSGVLLLGLAPVEGETKRLYDDEDYQADRKLMAAIDAVNTKYGRSTIRFGLSSKKQTRWHMNRNHLSPSYTTKLQETLRIELSANGGKNTGNPGLSTLDKKYAKEFV